MARFTWAAMTETLRQIDVEADHFEVVSDDVVLAADLANTFAVCLYDAVEEPGALLHLRFIARGDVRADVTDRTLASDLLLLDRCMETLRAAAPRAQHWQGKIVSHTDGSEHMRQAADVVLEMVDAFLTDALVKIISCDVAPDDRRHIEFRPMMGQLRT
ncbi:MAG: hypothetical protein R3E77_00400 [Steroidobacteraceae bacterium]